VALVLGLLLLFTGCAGVQESPSAASAQAGSASSPEKTESSGSSGNSSAGSSFVSNVAPAPDPQEQLWPYTQLDVEYVRKLGHLGHYEGGCAYGAFNAVIQPLQEQVGYPYNQIPTFMLDFGKGGVLGTGGTCGTVLGTLAAINLIAGKDYPSIAAELMDYYRTTPFPTETSNDYAVNHEFLVDEYRTDEALPQSVAGSLSCEDSDAKWLAVAGVEPGTPEAKERCARMTGDMAAKAVSLLNEWAAERAEGGGTAQQNQFGGLFANATEFTEVAEGVYRANQACQELGYVGLVEGSGYEDGLVVAVAVGTDGTIAGVRVVEHNETPNIGGKITEDEFLSQFQGMSPDEVQLASEGGNIDALSGATVSSSAVTEMVRTKAQTLAQHAQ
jgi:RnfABCDGE-type electron transport complex G subunit